MTENINPVALADETGVVYTEGNAAPVYLLLQVKKDDSGDSVNVDISSEGLDREQAIAVLEGILASLKNEDDLNQDVVLPL